MKNNNLGYMYISEETSPQSSNITNFEVVDNHGVFFVRFKACLHSFDVMNRNGRRYLKENVVPQLQTERIQCLVRGGKFYGENDHPQSYVKDQQLSSERINTIDMKNTSHRMLDPHVEGNLLVSTIESDSGTEVGMGLARKMVQGGYIPSFSCRAIASLGMYDGKPTVDVKKIITYDHVLYPSHREANMMGSTKFINKKANGLVNESTHTDIIVPLSDIVDDLGRKCDNVKVMMEAFSLTPDNICGYDRKKKMAVFKDKTNTIYCNVDKSTVDRMKDIMSSFNIN